MPFAGGIFVAFCTEPLVRFFGGTKTELIDGIETLVAADPQTGWFWTVVCYAILAVVLFTITFLTTKERVVPEQVKNSSIGQDIFDLVRNRPWIVLLFVGLFQILAGKHLPYPIIFITGHGTVPASVRAFKAGAMDFLQKPFNNQELLDAVSHGVKQDRRMRREQKEMLTLRSRLEKLTPREYEVFSHVVSGMLNKQIAFDLGVAEKTVKVHRARVMEKMGAQSFADLVRFAEKLQIHP